jgi:hypothetical protein
MSNPGGGSFARSVLVPVLIAMASMALASPARAGRNTNGRLVVHTDDSIVYTATADYCSTALPGMCEEFNANGNQGIEREQVIWLVAAFQPESSPGVTAIQFGINHNLPAGQGYFTRCSVCGPWPLEFQDSGWPETGLGDVIGYGAPVYDHLFPFYWFAVFREDDGNYFGTRTYPVTNEAKFVDDSNPPVEDLIYIFGTVRWDGTGTTGCEWGVPHQGACCYPDGTCQLETIMHCEGHYLGDDTVCTPNPCQRPEACCFEDGSCRDMLAGDCATLDGFPLGEGTSCATDSCPPMPVACCFCDATCQMLLEADCIAQGGLPFGPGSECEEIQCAPPPAGACCFGQDCLLMDERCCGIAGGVFEGLGTLCDPNPCVETPVHSTTWGRIKASYR